MNENADELFYIPDYEISVPLCSKWFEFTNSNFVTVVGGAVSSMIVILNFLVRLLFMAIAEVIGFNDNSVKASFITFSVFYTSFFQTGLLCLIASMDSREYKLGPFNALFSGIYTDFNAQWFSDIGSVIINNMLFNAVWPFAEFFMFYSVRHVKRAWD